MTRERFNCGTPRARSRWSASPLPLASAVVFVRPALPTLWSVLCVCVRTGDSGALRAPGHRARNNSLLSTTVRAPLKTVGCCREAQHRLSSERAAIGGHGTPRMHAVQGCGVRSMRAVGSEGSPRGAPEQVILGQGDPMILLQPSHVYSYSCTVQTLSTYSLLTRFAPEVCDG